jgi:hypothetical protein
LRGNRFTIILLRCDRPSPPPRKEDDVRQEGVINCIVDTPFEQLSQHTNPQGEVWRNLDFQVEMKPQGTMLEFAVYYQGMRQRSLQVNPPFATAGDPAPLPGDSAPPAYAPPPPPLLLAEQRTGNERPLSLY